MLPFNETEYLYQPYMGWEPSWLGLFNYVINSSIMGTAGYFFLRRKITLFTVIAGVSAISTMLIQGIVAGLWLVGLVLLMLSACHIATRLASQKT
ncbi:hypothetical protein ACMXYW_04630 [Neptuniibacter sp. QD48_55]|uniref:hypothetical protein n=1 Tax=Neptuniibacter sp. QD48_55 TaxID=3398212 RepID=UPI0039F624DE